MSSHYLVKHISTKFHITLKKITYKFIHPFIQAISIASLTVLCCSEALPTQHGYCLGISRLSATGNFVIKLLKVLTCTWRLERESNLWLFGRKASTLPKRRHAPYCTGCTENPFYRAGCQSEWGILSFCKEATARHIPNISGWGFVFQQDGALAQSSTRHRRFLKRKAPDTVAAEFTGSEPSRL